MANITSLFVRMRSQFPRIASCRSEIAADAEISMKAKGEGRGDDDDEIVLLTYALYNPGWP